MPANKKSSYLAIIVLFFSFFTSYPCLSFEVLSSKKIIVQPQQTIYAISRKYDVHPKDIIELNRIKPPFTIYKGQSLYIPVKMKQKNTRTFKKNYVQASNRETITVKKGDTLFSIARNNNISTRDIININNLIPPFKLSIGQKLVIPATRFYTVRENDTLYKVSRFFNVPMNQIVNINNLKPPYRIYKKQKLIIPTERVASREKKQLKTFISNNKKPLFTWPIRGKILKKFGKTKPGQKHEGINIAASKGATVYAAEEGLVVYTGNALKQYGKLILIKHSHGYMTAYAHLDTFIVKKGMRIKKREKIGTAGRTGNVEQTQLHFQIRKNNRVVNPRKLLK